MKFNKILTNLRNVQFFGKKSSKNYKSGAKFLCESDFWFEKSYNIYKQAAKKWKQKNYFSGHKSNSMKA